MVLDEFVRLGAVARGERLRVPLDFLPNAKGDVPEQRGFRQRGGVIKIARRRSAGLARKQPLRVVSDGVGDDRFRSCEPGEILLRQQQVLAVVGKNLALRSNKKHAAVPLRDLISGQNLRQ